MIGEPEWGGKGSVRRRQDFDVYRTHFEEIDWTKDKCPVCHLTRPCPTEQFFSQPHTPNTNESEQNAS